VSFLLRYMCMCCWGFVSFQMLRCVEWWIINRCFEGSWFLLQGLIALGMFRTFAMSVPISLSLRPRRPDCMPVMVSAVGVYPTPAACDAFRCNTQSVRFFTVRLLFKLDWDFSGHSCALPDSLLPLYTQSLCNQPYYQETELHAPPHPQLSEKTLFSFSCSPLLITLNWRV
jgi:hypothetical protein